VVKNRNCRTVRRTCVETNFGSNGTEFGRAVDRWNLYSGELVWVGLRPGSIIQDIYDSADCVNDF
jgi:hypothetical protein